MLNNRSDKLGEAIYYRRADQRNRRLSTGWQLNSIDKTQGATNFIKAT